ncbi:hypothetical protein CU098_000763, partial [Rhizopus stolonifer]
MTKYLDASSNPFDHHFCRKKKPRVGYMTNLSLPKITDTFPPISRYTQRSWYSQLTSTWTFTRYKFRRKQLSLDFISKVQVWCRFSSRCREKPAPLRRSDDNSRIQTNAILGCYQDNLKKMINNKDVPINIKGKAGVLKGNTK